MLGVYGIRREEMENKEKAFAGRRPKGKYTPNETTRLVHVLPQPFNLMDVREVCLNLRSTFVLLLL